MRRVVGSAVALVVALAFARTAHADEPASPADPDPQAGALEPVLSDDDPHDEFEAFPRVKPHGKHHLRALVEVGGVVIVGFVDYLLNTSARGGEVRAGDERWSLRYDWPDLRGKLVGTAYELDANRFGTNYASHPFAGTLYYHAARSNHLGVAEAFAFSVFGSSTWEFFGEIREKVSINDLVVTPVAGMAIGEATMQLAGFFDRGRKNVPNRILSFLFSPVKAVNEVIDEGEPLRSTSTDALGFATEPWHRFQVHAGLGTTIQDSTHTPSGAFAAASYPDVSFGTSFELANLPGYRSAGRHARIFDDGNLSRLSFDATMSRGDLVSAVFATRVVPVGYYHRDAELRDGRPYGHGAALGLRIGFEYGTHEYDRDRARVRDLISFVSPLGIAAEHTWQAGRLRVSTGLDIAGAIAGVQPYALSDYRVGRQLAGLPAAIGADGYYHSIAVTAAPRVDVAYGPLQLENEMRLDTFRAIEGLDADRSSRNSALDLGDRRMLLRSALAIQPAGLPARLVLGVRRMMRDGHIGTVHASRGETTLTGSIGVVF